VLPSPLTTDPSDVQTSEEKSSEYSTWYVPPGRESQQIETLDPDSSQRLGCTNETPTWSNATSTEAVADEVSVKATVVNVQDAWKSCAASCAITK